MKRNVISYRPYSVLLIASLLFFLASFIVELIGGNRDLLERETGSLQKYVREKQLEIQDLSSRQQEILKLAQPSFSKGVLNEFLAKDIAVFVYVQEPSGAVLKFWNTQSIIPPVDFLLSKRIDTFQKLANGYYLLHKKLIASDARRFWIVCMVPIQYAYFIESDYLPGRFANKKASQSGYSISLSPTKYKVESLQGNALFYLKQKYAAYSGVQDWSIFILRIIACILLLSSIHSLSTYLVRKNTAFSILFLSSSLIIIRIITYLFPAFFYLKQFGVFDPSIYGTNIALSSLGDLTINMLLCYWIVRFIWSQRTFISTWYMAMVSRNKIILSAAASLLLVLGTFIFAFIIKSLVADSKISFDVTNYYSLSMYTAIGFFAIATLALCYYYFSRILMGFIFPVFVKDVWWTYLLISTIGLIYLSIMGDYKQVIFYLPILGYLIIYTWMFHNENWLLTRFRINVNALLFWMFIFSVFIATVMFSENKSVEWQRRKQYAEKMAFQSDPANQRILSISLSYLDELFLKENATRLFDKALSKKLRDSIITTGYSGYLNNYDTRLYIFNAKSEPVYNEDTATTYIALETILNQSQPIDGSSVRFYETALDKYIYIIRKSIKDINDIELGYFYIISYPRKGNVESLLPELFNMYKQNPEVAPVYYHGIYFRNRLGDYSSNYPFPVQLTVDNTRSAEEVSKVRNGVYDELWYRVNNEKTVIIARKRNTLFEALTLFSYLFCSFLIVVFLMSVLTIISHFMRERGGLLPQLNLRIRNQIHATFIIVNIISFLIIGLTTIGFIKRRYDENSTEKLSRIMSLVVNDITGQKSIIPTTINQDTTSVSIALQKKIEYLAAIHGVNLNVYNMQGDLQNSSEQAVYSNGVLSTKMEPRAFYNLSQGGQVEYSQIEVAAQLQYLSMYNMLRDKNGVTYAYLNIPYFTSRPELNKEISNFIVTIVNLNAFIFILGGLIALLLTNRITRSFSIISKKMQDVNLTTHNEEIIWNRDDEIGDLVKEYNKMVSKLAQNVETLAKTEREGAWREMARQVAHEIKNPLTPMKLSMQHLQKAIEQDRPNVKQLAINVSQTLVEQIDHLSKIASEFSQFANIGKPQLEIFDLHKTIYSLQKLYEMESRVQFEWKAIASPAFVKADKTQMNRLFTNLFSNAIEACDKETCAIKIQESLLPKKIEIKITDNGGGIPLAMQPKIFTPYFTTKTSGTGLGLAMCMGIVEQAGGTIKFTTSEGIGTTFMVTLPLQSEQDSNPV